MTRLPRLHLVTSRSILLESTFLPLARELLSAGGSEVALHIRGHGMTGRRVWEIVADCAAAAGRSGAALIVNDRIDVALACGAAGVQLGSRSFAVPTARALVGPERRIGVSIHSESEAVGALEGGADFVLAGTLFDSPSHPEDGGRGLGWLKSVTAIAIPVIAIGGIRPIDVGSVLKAGARGVAVASGVFATADPVAALQEYLEELG